jgi:hypothetical protein
MNTTTEYPEDPSRTGGVPPGSTNSGSRNAGPPDADSLNEIARNIADAATWLRFMAILGFVGAGLLAVTGIVFLFIRIPPYGGYSRLIGVFYLLAAGVYFIPLIPLNRSASFASRLKTAISYEVTVQALRSQAVFWRRMGILSIIALAFSVISIPIAFIFARIAGAGRF